MTKSKRRFTNSFQSYEKTNKYLSNLIWAIIGAGVLIGVLIRIWYMIHIPIVSDEAVVGLIANAALHGHFQVFYWGQVYGGTGEPLITAALFAILGHTAFVLKLTPALLSAVSAILVYRIALRLISSKQIAALTGVMSWVAPGIVVSLSTIEGGFRGLTMACGLAMMLVTLRILDQSENKFEFITLGLIAGIGWWSSAEIVYFAVPSALLFAGAFIKHRNRQRQYLKRLPLLVMSLGLGSLPWLWANLKSGFLSLSTSSFSLPPNTPGYWQKLHDFFRFTLPMMLGLRGIGPTASWQFNRTIGLCCLVLFLLVVVYTTITAVRNKDRILAIVVSLLVFPFIFAYVPGTWFWYDGRYAVYLVPLIALLIGVGIFNLSNSLLNHPKQAKIAGSALMTVMFIVACIFSLAHFYDVADNSYYKSMAQGNDPNEPTIKAINSLEKQRINYGYAGYWVAYRVDFLSQGRLNITGYDIQRSAKLEKTVTDAKYQSFLFVKSNPTAQTQFGYNVGIPGLTESSLMELLNQEHRTYRVMNNSLFNVVVAANPDHQCLGDCNN